jgi:hypothetical protein
MSHGEPNPFEEATKPQYRTAPAPAQGPPPAYNAPGSAPPAYAAPNGHDAAPQQPQFYQTTGSQGYANSTPYNPPPAVDAYGQNAHPTASPTGYYNQPHPGTQPPPGAAEAQPQTYEQPPPARDLKTSKFWELAFYRQFFDVDTVDVLRRMGNTLVPISPPDFLLFRRWHANQRNGIPVESNPTPAVADPNSPAERFPDLYGPFWICTTLWMTLAIVGNMMSRISYARTVANTVPSPPVTTTTGLVLTSAPIAAWSYDFTVASVACVVIYTYCAGMSLLLWGIMKWKNVPVTLVDTVALYGYSMFIFLLVAILCAVPFTLLQWIACLVGGVWSTSYLLLNLWHIWKLKLHGVWFTGVVLLVSLMHMGIMMSFKFYFTNYAI